MKLKINENNLVENEYLMEMANVVGKYVKRLNKLPFSFYFSKDDGNPHGIRVKPAFNPEKIIRKQLGELRLHGKWEYVPSDIDKDIDSREIRKMKKFFRKYLVLFCAVWDELLDEYPVQAYLRNEFTLQDVIKAFEFYDKHSDDLNNITTIEELERYCRENNLVNLYGN